MPWLHFVLTRFFLVELTKIVRFDYWTTFFHYWDRFFENIFFFLFLLLLTFTSLKTFFLKAVYVTLSIFASLSSFNSSQQRQNLIGKTLSQVSQKTFDAYFFLYWLINVLMSFWNLLDSTMHLFKQVKDVILKTFETRSLILLHVCKISAYHFVKSSTHQYLNLNDILFSIVLQFLWSFNVWFITLGLILVFLSLFIFNLISSLELSLLELSLPLISYSSIFINLSTCALSVIACYSYFLLYFNLTLSLWTIISERTLRTILYF